MWCVSLRQQGVYRSSFDSGAYEKLTTKIRTPRVADAARTHFGCDDLDGVRVPATCYHRCASTNVWSRWCAMQLPLEDDVTHKGTVWEARVVGPAVMSAGWDLGEPYLSSFTLAFLEDTCE